MSQTDQEQAFAERLRKRLANEPTLDGRTRSRLNQARQAALAELDRPGRAFMTAPGGWLTAGGALAAGVVVALMLRQGGISPTAPRFMPVDDLEIILSEGELELYDDLEFYAWIDMQPEVG